MVELGRSKMEEDMLYNIYVGGELYAVCSQEMDAVAQCVEYHRELDEGVTAFEVSPQGEEVEYNWMKAYEELCNLWKNLDPQEKVDLMLAHHRGEQIELYNFEGSCKWVPSLTEDLWKDDLAYRIRPELKRETVTLYTGGIDYLAASTILMGGDTHRIVFDLIDGKPDLDSIRMEEL